MLSGSSPHGTVERTTGRLANVHQHVFFVAVLSSSPALDLTWAVEKRKIYLYSDGEARQSQAVLLCFFTMVTPPNRRLE